MLRKIRRLGWYALYVFLFAALYPAAAVLRRVSPAYRGLWLIQERGFDARDNGYWFFRHLRENHPEINACFVIDPGSPDAEKVARLGDTVPWRSIRHHLKYLAADYLISTHVMPASPDLMAYYHLRQAGIRARGKQVFLQHGIISNDMAIMHYPRLRLDLFVCGARKEYEALRRDLGFPDGILRYLGLCRYDRLAPGSAGRKEILIMPTWRGSDYPRGEAFRETEYFRRFQSLLNREELIRLAEEKDLRILFYPHIEIQPELSRFTASSDRVVLADWRNYDVQDLLKRCAMLVTDYSSVYFDVAYMEKPVVYYQFDRDEFYRIHYGQGYFSFENDGFGPVLTEEEALVREIRACAERGFTVTEEYGARIAAFFPRRDQKNCERTYEAIRNLGKGS